MSNQDELTQDNLAAELMLDEIQEQLAQKESELDGMRKAQKSAQAQNQSLKAELEQLQGLYSNLQLSRIEMERVMHDLNKRHDELKMRLAFSEDTVSNLNHSLTYCQNKSWELMTNLRDYMETPGFLVGHYYQHMSKNWLKAFKCSVLWGLNHLLRRPYVLAKELSATYPVQEARGGLEHLAIYARDAKRQISDLPIATPTSMSGANLHMARRPRPDIIVYSITNWTFRQQRPQHLVNGLVREGSRAFVMPTDLIGLGIEHPTDRQIMERMAIRPIGENLWEVQPCAFNPLNIYRDNISDIRDLRLLRRSLTLLRQRFGIGEHLGLVQLPFWGPLAASMPGSRIIYDCMDNHRDFSTNSEGMLSQEDQLLVDADAVIVSSIFLDEAVADKPKAKHLIRNACEYDYFATEPEALDPVITGLKGPIIGYYGAIADWFDVKLLEEVVARRPDWNFVLIGHTFGADIERLQAMPNVTFTGEIPYNRLTSFLYGFDVCMIPFRLTDLILATNPVKIYEYSAAGKPTVATRIPEVERLGSELATVVDDAAGFVSAIERYLAEPDKAGQAARLRQFAKENTWAARVEDVEQVIRQHAYPRISVIILSYNNWPITYDCLQSILNETTYPNMEVIVIDNASDAETREQLAAMSKLGDPRMKVVFNDANLGYAGGNNQGMEMADGDYLVLLNSDTICPPDWLERILKHFADPQVGMVGPMTNSAGNEQMLDSLCTSKLDQREWLKEFYRLREGRFHETDRLGFFCVAVRRTAYDQIGGLDAGFEVGYFEDDDYCKRFVNEGWKLVVAEDAFVFHHGSASFKKLDQELRKQIEIKNRERFETKHNCKWTNPICEYMHYGEEGPGFEARPVAIIGACQDWNVAKGRPQQIALSLCRQGYTVYYVTHNKEKDQYLGIRLLRPFLYAVECRDEWLDEICEEPVALVISFGREADGVLARVRAKRLVLDLSTGDVTAASRWNPADSWFQRTAENVHWITVSEQALVEQLPEQLRGKTVLIPDGIELDHFKRPRTILPPKEIEKAVQEGGGPVVACLAPLNDSLDWEWLEDFAKLHRSCTLLIFADPTVRPAERQSDLFNLRNVQLISDCAYCDLPDYLAHADLGVCAPAAGAGAGDRHANGLLHLAAAGLPVIANRALELAGMEEILHVRANGQEAGSLIEECIRKRYDLRFSQACQAAAKAHDWSEIIAQFILQIPQE